MREISNPPGLAKLPGELVKLVLGTGTLFES